jgi:hypothetical protein
VVAQNFVGGIRRAVAAAGLTAGIVDEEQSIGASHRHPFEQDGVDEAEDRGICANAQRQRQHRDNREAWRAAQDAPGIAQVVPPLVDEPQPNRLPTLLDTGVRTAEVCPGAASRLFGGEPAANEIRGVEVHVLAHLVARLIVESAATERPPPRSQQMDHRFHPATTLLANLGESTRALLSRQGEAISGFS